MVADRFERARAEAEAADRRLTQPGPHPPLLGVPCTVKEFLAVEGMPHTAGLTVRRGTIADSDAEVVRRIRAAGAIVMGVTNGPEGGLWSETVNKVYGRTSNPWNRRHTSGGSSGGEGAIIAAGGSPFGLGSDIGGSVRIPAAHCGVAAHKPTGGVVPTAGHHPANDSDYLVVGPMARRVEDLALLLPILSGTAAERLAQPTVEDLTVWLPDEGLAPCSPPVRAAVLAAADALRDRGATVTPVSLPALNHAFGIWLATLATAGFPSYAEVLGDGPRARILPALAQALVGGGPYTLPPLLVSLVEEVGQRVPVLNETRLLTLREQLAADLGERLTERAVLLLPTVPRTAPRHSGSLLRFAENGLCGVFNVLGLPATQVPVGLSPAGMPMGVQLVGGRGLDRITLAVAAAVEAGLGGWQPPPDPQATLA